MTIPFPLGETARDLLRQAEGAERVFQRLLEAVPDAMVIVSGEGRILLGNRQTEALFGYSEEELAGRLVEDLLPERFRQRHLQHRAGYMQTPRVRSMGEGLELLGLHKGGSEFPVEISLSPMELQRQVIVIATVRDITARKRVETERAEALERLQAIQTVTDVALGDLEVNALLQNLLQRVRDVLAADTVAILLLDETGQQLVARAALGLEEEVEQGIHIPFGGGFAGRIAAERRAVMVDDTSQIELVNPLLRAKGVRSLLGVPLLAEGRVLGVLHVGTLQPRQFSHNEAELLQLVADRVALAIDRARLYDEAQHAIRLRNEFLSAISHDLGNSVAAIRLQSRLLGDEARESGQAGDLVEGLELIETTATQTWNMVEELLDLARLQVGRDLELNWRRIDLEATVRRLVALHQHQTAEHKLRLEVAAASFIGEWDTNRLERIINNLLSNAVKYSPKGGEVVVRLNAAEDPDRPGGWVILEVQDQGIGIPATDLPHIFERFHRASNVVGRFPGTGIGLAGARQIVEHHGGTLTVTSEEGAGTRVTARLPRGEAAE